ncbi:PREDICTED: uncharacterized protein LOC104778413 [Camelina sativa]|uniref:Uncharacterized protein LOC104778411 n=1 Tax=Camelina sativa TaxID=90675 RepID=A0ABM0YI02_CAMSA|nr:PREDICTED: uncharacterized protein LOC104778411 [Camelina sativa]XP_010501157.1 PREDICTED: uncharacterized protein LOC104778413 [Camelina sativa]
MINCFKDSIHVLMTVLLSTNDDDDDHEEAVNHVDGHRNHEVREEVDAKEYEGQSGGVTTLTLKSSLRKADSNSTEAGKKEKKKVQWVDVTGKELAEIREFEPSEEDNIDSDRGKTCVCVIL